MTVATTQAPRPDADAVAALSTGALRPVCILAAAFRSRRELLQALTAHPDGRGELRVATRANPALYEPLIVEVSCPGMTQGVQLRGRAARREPGSGLLRVVFEGDQRSAFDFLMWFAAGKLGPVTARRHPRYSVHLPVRWRPFGQVLLREGRIENLSAGGARLTADSGAPAGERIVLRARAAMVGELVMTAHVLACAAGAQGPAVMRVRFAAHATAEARDLRRLLRAFASLGRVVDSH